MITTEIDRNGEMKRCSLQNWSRRPDTKETIHGTGH